MAVQVRRIILAICLVMASGPAGVARAADWTMCTHPFTTDSSGTLYDSGGASGNYSDDENCSFLLDPPAGSYTLEVSIECALEDSYDYLDVYEGTDESGTWIRSYTGNITDVLIYHNGSGPLFFKFTSDSSITDSGFTVSWFISDYSISGTVFEDVGFAGSATNFGAGDLALPSVDVELYDSSNAYIASAATDANGQYSFGGLSDGTYKVRVRSATIGDSNTPPAGGFKSACGVTDPASGTPCALAELTWANNSALYGGQSAWGDDTATADNAGPGDSFTTVTISGADLTGVNFGVAYNLIVNTADSGQGSLRSFIQNANAIAGTQTSQFRIPLTDPNYNGSGHGELTIRPLTAFPSITDPIILDGSTQTANIGNTNGAGPEIELNGSGAGSANGFELLAGSNGSTIRAVVINRFSRNGISTSWTGSLVIQGTYIGTDVTGTVAQGNRDLGIYLNCSPNNTVGGTTAGDGNLISGNGLVGLSIFGSACTGSVIQGNRIGTDRMGMLDLGNGICGVIIEDGSSGNTVGGSVPAARNIISGNNGSGMIIRHSGTTANTVIGNYFGLGADGATPVGNTQYGILIDWGASGNIIGGSQSGECNVIAGNAASGVRIEGSNNTIKGNLVGLASNGATPVANGAYGIQIAAVVSGNIIGGAMSMERNVIAGNTLSGVSIEGLNNSVMGNYMGLASNGSTPVANGQHGIHIFSGATGNTIGGSQIERRNTIAGNTLSGILIEGSNNTATGNYIGFGADCSTPVGNGQYGVYIASGAAGNRIGGSPSGEMNVIGYSGNAGVAIAGTDNAVVGNRILNNGGLGIDLLGGVPDAFGVNANDPGDGDSGSNSMLNFPEITWAAAQSGNISINFDLDVPTGNYRIEFFRNPSGADPSGHGEGEYIAGSKVISHPGGGLHSFSHTMWGSAGDMITATATLDSGGGAFGDTSEFSRVYTVMALPQITISKSSSIYSDPVNSTTNPKHIPGAFVDYSIAVSNLGPGTSDSGTVMITHAIAGQTVLFVGDLAAAGSGPVEFSDGSPVSGLGYIFGGLASSADSLLFSNDNGATYTYIPVPGGDGCDPLVTHLRINPTGIFNGSDGTNHPNFAFRFRVSLKGV